MSIPAHLSSGARQFLHQSLGVPFQRVNLTNPQEVTQLREETKTFAIPGCHKMRDKHNAIITEDTIGGVRVQIISHASIEEESEVILYFFGGGFVVGSPEEDWTITIPLMMGTRRKVICPYYKLAPENPFPAAMEDAFSVYDALVSTPQRRVVAVVGESAGGNLALNVVLRTSSPPQCLILFSPWIDLTLSGDTYTTLRGVEPTMGTEEFLRPCAEAYVFGSGPSGSPEALQNPNVSPLFNPALTTLPRTFPSTYISTGTKDLLLSDCARLNTVMRRSNRGGLVNPIEFSIQEGMWHVYEYYSETEEAASSLDDVVYFLVRELNKK